MVDPTIPQGVALTTVAGEAPKAPVFEAENRLQQRLVEKFPFLADQFTIPRARRMWVKLPMDHLHEVLTP